MKLNKTISLKLIAFIFLFPIIAAAQTTGKISGKVIDAGNGEPVVGANIIVNGTRLGAASDIDGSYFIINIPPGNYSLTASMIGYEQLKIEGVKVSVNRTTNLDIELKQSATVLEEVVVKVARGVSEKKDQTSSVKNVSADAIALLPVENIQSVIEMQAGVVGGHFRGGRSTEVSYLVDGMSTTETFQRTGNSVEIETEAVQDLEVITGTFNAEYGRAMSGVVNMVTKDGGNNFHSSFSSSVSNYFTSHKDIFVGLKNSDLSRNQDYKLQVEGPIIKDYLTFFANARYEDNKKYLNGIRRFNVNDYTDFNRSDLIKNKTGVAYQSQWNTDINGSTYYSEHTGDNAYVPMDGNKSYSLLGKLTIKPFNPVKLSFLYNVNNSEYQNYSHYWKYNPDGRATSYDRSDFFLIQFNHVLSNSIFYDLKLSYTGKSYKRYLYEDPFDPRYVATEYATNGGGFMTGGQEMAFDKNSSQDWNIKYDLTWQATHNHSLKSGFLYTRHVLKNDPTIVRDQKYGTSLSGVFSYDAANDRLVFNPWQPELLTESYRWDNYKKEPYEYSVYLQDKMEFDELVINLGLRYDYFNANTVFPTQLRNPANQDYYPDSTGRMSTYPKVNAQKQLSPRFGLSYTLGKAAVLHFSYGHFFQMPPMYALYQNSRFLIPSSDYSTVLGNPNIKAEKTVKYEMGLWQEILPGMGIDMSVYYSDIYDLQSAIIVTTYSQIKYGLFSNKDYGNIKGFEFKYDYTTGPVALNVNYTLQYTRGNADSPTSTFDRAGNNKDEIPKLIALGWDQRHTLNASINYAADNLNVTLIGFYGSGVVYTFEPISESPLSKQTLYPNNETRPAQYRIDLKGSYDINLFNAGKLRLYLSVYNLLDRLNEASVNAYTGRAYTTIVRPTQITTFRSNYSDIYDSAQDPSMYTAPREIKFGVGFIF